MGECVVFITNIFHWTQRNVMLKYLLKLYAAYNVWF